MIGEIGHFALWVALAVAGVQTCLGLIGGHANDMRLIRVATNAANAQMLLIVLAFSCLAVSFIESDFTLINVANNSNSRLPVKATDISRALSVTTKETRVPSRTTLPGCTSPPMRKCRPRGASCCATCVGV